MLRVNLPGCEAAVNTRCGIELIEYIFVQKQNRFDNKVQTERSEKHLQHGESKGGGDETLICHRDLE